SGWMLFVLSRPGSAGKPDRKPRRRVSDEDGFPRGSLPLPGTVPARADRPGRGLAAVPGSAAERHLDREGPGRFLVEEGTARGVGARGGRGLQQPRGGRR